MGSNALLPYLDVEGTVYPNNLPLAALCPAGTKQGGTLYWLTSVMPPVEGTGTAAVPP